MNTKNITDKEERKKLKRASRKKAAPKEKVKKMSKGQRKR